MFLIKPYAGVYIKPSANNNLLGVQPWAKIIKHVDQAKPSRKEVKYQLAPTWKTFPTYLHLAYRKIFLPISSMDNFWLHQCRGLGRDQLLHSSQRTNKSLFLLLGYLTSHSSFWGLSESPWVTEIIYFPTR